MENEDNNGNISHRKIFYKKYKSSDIFNTDLSISENIPPITPKPNERKYNKIFEPQYNTLSSYEMYLKQFYIKDNSKIKKLSTEKKYNNFINHMRKKSDNYQMRRNYSARGRYFSEFFGEKYYHNNKEKYKKDKLKRINSFYEIRSINFPKENINNHSNLNNLTSRTFSQEKKFESNLSNIFFDKPKNFKYKKPEKINNKSLEKEITNLKKNKISKLNLPYKYDWKYLNTEIATKKNIQNYKELKNKKIYNSKPKDFTKETSDNTFSPYKEKRENYKKIQPDKDHYKYEIIGNKNLFLKLEPITIKRMFLDNGIHIYNLCGDITNNDLITQGKVTFNLRKDKNDKSFDKKFENICQKINSYGVKLNEVITNTNLYKKIRDATPGKELKKNIII